MHIHFLLKKTSVILLLVIVFLSQWGYYCYCGIQLYIVKQEARKQLLKKIPTDFLVKIALDDNKALQWEEEDEEFSLDGEMYDVVKLEYQNGKKYAFCINDKKEDQVNAALDKVIESNSSGASNNSKPHFPAKIAAPEWIFELQSAIPSREDLSAILREYPVYTSSLYYRYIKILSPPPDINFKPNTKNEKIYTTSAVAVFGRHINLCRHLCILQTTARSQGTINC